MSNKFLEEVKAFEQAFPNRCWLVRKGPNKDDVPRYLASSSPYDYKIIAGKLNPALIRVRADDPVAALVLLHADVRTYEESNA